MGITPVKPADPASPFTVLTQHRRHPRAAISRCSEDPHVGDHHRCQHSPGEERTNPAGSSPADPQRSAAILEAGRRTLVSRELSQSLSPDAPAHSRIRKLEPGTRTAARPLLSAKPLGSAPSCRNCPAISTPKPAPPTATLPSTTTARASAYISHRRQRLRHHRPAMLLRLRIPAGLASETWQRGTSEPSPRPTASRPEGDSRASSPAASPVKPGMAPQPRSAKSRSTRPATPTHPRYPPARAPRSRSPRAAITFPQLVHHPPAPRQVPLPPHRLDPRRGPEPHRGGRPRDHAHRPGHDLLGEDLGLTRTVSPSSSTPSPRSPACAGSASSTPIPTRSPHACSKTMARHDQRRQVPRCPPPARLRHRPQDHEAWRQRADLPADLIAKARRIVPGIVIRTSFIVGFPGETEADFQILCDFVQAAQIDWLGVFTYSDEEGAHAFDLDPETQSFPAAPSKPAAAG